MRNLSARKMSGERCFQAAPLANFIRFHDHTSSETTKSMQEEKHKFRKDMYIVLPMSVMEGIKHTKHGLDRCLQTNAAKTLNHSQSSWILRDHIEPKMIRSFRPSKFQVQVPSQSFSLKIIKKS